MRFGKMYGWTAIALVVLVVGAAVAATQMTASSSTIFGQATLTTGTAAAGAYNLSEPVGAFVDADGRLWVADQSNNRVLMYNSITDTKAQLALGLGNDTTLTAGAAMNQASLSSPISVSYYKGTYAQFIAVNDVGNKRILIWAYPKDSNLISILQKGNTNIGETYPRIVIGQDTFGVPSTDSVIVNVPDDSSVSLAARHAFDVKLAAASSGDTVYLFVSSETLTVGGVHASNRIYRFPLRDSWSWTSVETALLPNRTTAVGTPFGQAPKADYLFGAATNADTAAGVSATKMTAPSGLSILSGSLYVADAGNNRIVRFDTVTNTVPDTTADAVWGQRNLTIGTVGWTAGSETGLKTPIGLVVTSGGVVATDSPASGGSARVIVFDGVTDTTADRWFGMDATGNPVLPTAVNSTTLGSNALVAAYSSSVLAVDMDRNRILTLASALAGSTTAAVADDDNCVINATLGRTGLAGVMPAIRGVRDSILDSSFGRLLVSSYYGFGLAFLMVAGAGVAYARRKE